MDSDPGHIHRADHGDRMADRSAYARRVVQGDGLPRVPNEVTARRERQEQALDSIAVAVERLAAGPRGPPKPRSERTAPPGPGSTPQSG